MFFLQLIRVVTTKGEILCLTLKNSDNNLNTDMKIIYNGIVLILLIVTAGLKGAAQDDSRALLKKVVKENQDAVNAIAMYPTETRKIIFEATEYPEIIAKLNEMQKTSQDAFEKLISPFSKEEQEKIWNLTRYDSLISDLVADHKKSEDEINNILVNYPEEIHKTALEEGRNNYDLLVQIDRMNKSYNSDFELLLNGYPPEAVNAFREMINMPEVLDILFDHMQYTVVVGDYYKKNPDRVLHKTDSLNLVLTQKNNQESDDWKQSLNDDQQAQDEYTQAAQEYAQNNGYQPEEYNAPLTSDVTDYNAYSYNWWFGYPSWYPYDYWIPYPYWYDWGYYYGPGGQVVFFGLPSYYFMDWYFYYPEHFNKYPELSNHYYNYYHRHPESLNNNSISHVVNDWRIKNKDIITDAWDKDNSGRTRRFKEYGQLEMERNTYNSKNPQNQIDQIEFLQNKKDKYPLLSKDVSDKQPVQKYTKTIPVQGNNQGPVKQPAVKVPDHYKANMVVQPINKQTGQNLQQQNGNVKNNNFNKQQQPVYNRPQTNNNVSGQRPDNANKQTQNPNAVKQNENFNQIRNAREYHQNTWKQIQPQPQPVQQPQQNSTPPPSQQENHKVDQPARQDVQTPSNNKRK